MYKSFNGIELAQFGSLAVFYEYSDEASAYIKGEN
jgi:hypothetical protein